MKSHLLTENHNLNCTLAGINVKEYNDDMLKVYPGKLETLRLPLKSRSGMNYFEECRKVHEKHCEKAAKLITDEKSYTVLTPEGAEIQIEVPSRNPKCEECGLLFKTADNLEEHKEHVRMLNIASTRNEFVCKVCDFYFFDKIGVGKHANSKEHIEKCHGQKINPDEILFEYNISIETLSMKRRDFSTTGYKCKACDVFFPAKADKNIHIEKEIHVQKCRELGLDPAGDHFEDCSTDKKKNEKSKTERHIAMKDRIERAVKRKKQEYVTIELLGVRVPKNVTFNCLVCSVILQNRTQSIDHLNTPMHITNCVSKGIKSAACNLSVRSTDVPGVVGKSISELLGIASDAVFPLSEKERAVYMRQIRQSEKLPTLSNTSNVVYRVVVPGDPLVVTTERPNSNSEAPQRLYTVAKSSFPHVSETLSVSEKSQDSYFDSELNSLHSSNTISTDQLHAVSTSSVSLTGGTQNVSRDSEGNGLSYQITLQPCSNQEEADIKSDLDTAVSHILFQDENVVEISENMEFSSVDSNELSHFDIHN
jgi:hypothetical protein